MTPDLAIRRPIRALHGAELSSFPVWEWAVGEEHQHEASLLRPTTHAALPLDADGQFIVAATATLNGGESLPACMQVDVKRGKARITPLFLLVQNRHLDFTGDETTRVLNQLTRRLGSYAVSWQLAVPLGAASVPIGQPVKRSMATRLQQAWMRLRIAATGATVLAP